MRQAHKMSPVQARCASGVCAWSAIDSDNETVAVTGTLQAARAS